MIVVPNCLFPSSLLRHLRPSSFALSDKKLKETVKYPIIENVKINLKRFPPTLPVVDLSSATLRDTTGDIATSQISKGGLGSLYHGGNHVHKTLANLHILRNGLRGLLQTGHSNTMNKDSTQARSTTMAHLEPCSKHGQAIVVIVTLLEIINKKNERILQDKFTSELDLTTTRKAEISVGNGWTKPLKTRLTLHRYLEARPIVQLPASNQVYVDILGVNILVVNAGSKGRERFRRPLHYHQG
ncbi:hypothetical protein F5146DRAFT_1002537 [Armillaria mellea]|nr:hypothetical protein F5146DRAFT_1002537 [Armillaria mellea]